MSDEQALLAAIRAHPDEDTPRLIYADWLQENGQPERAEFVRLQCTPKPNAEQQARAAQLEDLHGGKWLAGLPHFSGAEWEFIRGFPEHLSVSLALLLEQYRAVARAPYLRFLTLCEVDNPTACDFVNRQWNPQWIGMEFRPDWDAEDNPANDFTPLIVAIASSAQVKELHQLRLSFTRLSRTAWRILDSLLEEFGDRLEIG